MAFSNFRSFISRPETLLKRLALISRNSGNMLNNKLNKLISFWTTFSHKFGGTPYIYNEKEMKLTIDPDAVWRMKRNYNLITVWLLFSLYTLFRFYMDHDAGRFYTTFTYWFCTVHLMSLYSITRWFPVDTCTLTNMSIQFLTNIQSTHMSTFNPDKSKVNLMAWYLLITLTTLTCTLTMSLEMFCIFDPNNGVFLARYVPENTYYFPFKILVVLTHVYLVTTLGASLTFTVGVLFMYLFYICMVIPKEFRVKAGRQYLSHSTLRASDNLCLYYRAFQVLNTNVMWLIGPFFVYNHTAFTLSPTYVNLTLIRHWGKLKLVVMVPLLIASPFLISGYSVVIFLGKNLYASNGKILDSWKKTEWGSSLKNKRMRKFRKSCMKMTVGHGKMFSIRKRTFLKYLKGISRGTLRALLTTRRS